MCISYFRDSKSASVLCIPGKCVGDNHIEELEAHCHISFVMKSHSCDLLVPNLFMHETVVELSLWYLVLVHRGQESLNELYFLGCVSFFLSALLKCDSSVL